MTPEAIRTALREVIDPEVGINVVDLGLVYEVAVEDGRARVLLTMTTPACPLGPYITEEAHATLRRHFPDAAAPAIEVTWSPPWDASRISDEGKRLLGWS